MRKVNELIWHCTATPEGREVTVAEIDQWHKARGWTGIGYHKVVHLDGSVSIGRPESKTGSHVAGRNTATLGYVYVGGTDARKRAKDTRTRAQKATMLRLSREAVEKYSLTMISGHNDYANKDCPCFDARAEYAHLVNLPADGMPEQDPAAAEGSAYVPSKTTAASSGVGTYGVYESGSQVIDAAEKVKTATASDADFLDKVYGWIDTLATSPRFWLGAALVGVSVFIWLNGRKEY